MKNIITYHLFLLLSVVIVVSCNQRGAEIPPLKETFSKNDKNPFGTYVAYRQLSQLFNRNEIWDNKAKLSVALLDEYGTGALYVNISKNFFVNQADIDAMLRFVNGGNSMFISSENIDTSFLNTIGFVQQKHDDFGMLIPEMKRTAVHLQPYFYTDSSFFSYFFLPLDNYFIGTVPSPRLKVLGTNENGKANFVVIFYGKGRFYLHAEPRAFSNYFLLQRENYHYLQNVFSFSPVTPSHIFWDDYYNKRNTAPNDGNKKGIAVLLQEPAMAWAFWLVLLLLLLYLLFNSKRRQRIIKPLSPNINTSVAFTETVGRLYLQNKDNKNIADKIITYFLEQIRNQYFLSTNNFNDEFISTLSRKSNVPKAETEKLFTLIYMIQQSADVDDKQLLSLNGRVEKFYKHKK